MKKYYVVRGTELYKKEDNNWEYQYSFDDSTSKLFDNLEDANNYYDSIKLNEQKEKELKFADYKTMYTYDSLDISDEMILSKTFDRDMMSVYKVMYLFK